MTTRPRNRRLLVTIVTLLLLLLLMLASLPAIAQDGAATPMAVPASGPVPININEIQPTSLTALNPTARFVLHVDGPTTAIVQALATTPGLAPALEITDPSGLQILSLANDAGLNIVQSPINLPNAGDYMIELRDRNGAAGDLVVALQPGTPQPPPVGLLPGQQTDGTVGALNSLQVYMFNALPSQALLLHVDGSLPMPAPVVTIKDAISGEPLALMSLQLSGVRYRIPTGAASYRVEVAYGGSPAQEPYVICLETEDGTLPCAPVGSLPPAATVVPTETAVAPLPPTVAPATSCVVQASGAGVNVRLGPDLVFPIVGVLSGSTTAPVIGVSFDGQWWQINFGGTVAWVSAAFTTTSGNCASVPVAAAPPTPVPASPTPVPTTAVPPTGVPPTGVPPTATNTPAPPTATSTPGIFIPPVTFVPIFPTATPTTGFILPPGVIVTLNPGILTAVAPTPFPFATFVFPGP